LSPDFLETKQKFRTARRRPGIPSGQRVDWQCGPWPSFGPFKALTIANCMAWSPKIDLAQRLRAIFWQNKLIFPPYTGRFTQRCIPGRVFGRYISVVDYHVGFFGRPEGTRRKMGLLPQLCPIWYLFLRFRDLSRGMAAEPASRMRTWRTFILTTRRSQPQTKAHGPATGKIIQGCVINYPSFLAPSIASCRVQFFSSQYQAV